MKINFKIHYETNVGESLYLLLDIKGKSNNETEAFALSCDENFVWTVQISLSDTPHELVYQYALLSADKSFIYEHGNKRKLSLPDNSVNVGIKDYWHVAFGESPFYSAVFADCIFKRNDVYVANQPENANIQFSLVCPEVAANQHIAIIGNQALWGDWSETNKVRLSDNNFPLWQIDFNTNDFSFPLEYKYVLVDTESDKIIDWEIEKNRTISSVEPDFYNRINDEYFTRSIPSWKGAGVAIPIFSLRSKDGFGVGEFTDLKKMVDWCIITNQRIIQTLPINDTILFHNNGDSYPYNAVSVYALHPIYLNLESVGALHDKQLVKYFEIQKAFFNSKETLDYQHVMTEKMAYFKAIFAQESKSVFESDAYLTFFQNNKEWLVPYAAFSYLRDVNGTPEYGKWSRYGEYNKLEIEALVQEDTSFYNEISIHYFLQYHLHLQLVEAHNYARSKGVVIKGDIPIGVSPMSVDAWVGKKIFNLQVQAGAPPDDFSVTGQNWGFPTYNWELMAKDNFSWWRKRFQKLAEYFDAYRIDHLLGFFRIWEIPSDAVWGLTGVFSPALPLTISDLKSKGLVWDAERFLKPYITQSVLADIFGEFADEVIRQFLMLDGRTRYKFKPQFDTQKKIVAYFGAIKSDEIKSKDILIQKGLLTLHCEVLFIADLYESDKYHPRISMQLSHTYKALPVQIQKILDPIYFDFYYSRHNEFWKNQALKKLPALISSTKMLVCGEDLGMVPESVPAVMNELEILSLEIQRMPKKSFTTFGLPIEAPYRSVCTTSSHDLSPLRAWWEEDVKLTQQYYNEVLGLEGSAPVSCDPLIIEKIIQQHLASHAMWVILPWQDWMALDEKLRNPNLNAERINVPSNPNNFWCYRMHISLEQLLGANELNERISHMISISKR